MPNYKKIRNAAFRRTAVLSDYVRHEKSWKEGWNECMRLDPRVRELVQCCLELREMLLSGIDGDFGKTQAFYDWQESAQKLIRAFDKESK